MNWTDYLLALPITLLTLFALGILMIDLMLPREQKSLNAVTALIRCRILCCGDMEDPNRPGILGFLSDRRLTGHLRC